MVENKSLFVKCDGGVIDDKVGECAMCYVVRAVMQVAVIARTGSGSESSV